MQITEIDDKEIYFYRIYEVTNDIDNMNYSFYGDREINRKLVDNGYIIAENKDEFKEILKDTYPNIHFGRKKNVDLGYQYVSVIYHSKYELYKSQMISYKCDNCGKQITTDYFNLNSCLINCALWIGIGKKTDEKYNFCCEECKNIYEQKLKDEETSKNGDMYVDEYVDRNSFNEYSDGYIYKITKKSTGEFYIGQTRYVPMYRWMQHLRTERFNIKNISDYIFEVIETCHVDMLNERESHYINMYKDNPLSLNIMIPKDKKQLSLEL